MVFKKVKKALFGYDIFISYSRKDSLDYAYSIAQYFMKKGYECYIDQLSSITPGRELPANINDAVKRSTAFVLIGSEGAQTSEAIEKEVQLFLENNQNKPLIPITIEDAISEHARWFEKIIGLALIDDKFENLKAGIPAQDVFDRIENALNFTKKANRLRKAAIAIGCISVLLISIALIASQMTAKALEAQQIAQMKQENAERLAKLADKDKATAQDSAVKATALAKRAKADAVIALAQKEIADSLTGLAKAEKIEAVRLSKLAKREAIKAARIAQSNFLAMNASTFRNTDPTLSYNLARIAYKIEPENVYTYNAIANSINNAPFYKDRIYLKDISDFAYSPDNKTVALLSSDKAILFYDRLTAHQKVVKLDVEGYSDNPSIIYSKDGKHLLTMFEDPVILNNTGEIVSILRNSIVEPTRTDADTRLHTDSAFFDQSGKYVITWSTLSSASTDTDSIVRKVWSINGTEESGLTELVPYKMIKSESFNDLKLRIEGNTILVSDQTKAEDFIEKDSYVPGVLRGHMGNLVQKARFSPRGDEIASIGSDDYFIIWNYQLPIESKIENKVDVKMNRKSPIILAYDNNSLVLKNLSSNTEKNFSEFKGIQNAEFFSNGVPYLITGKNIRIYNNKSWKNFEFRESIKQVIDAKGSPFCLLLGKNKLGVLYKDMSRFKLILKDKEISSVILSNDAQHIVVKYSDDRFSVYHINGKLIYSDTGNISSIEFTPESKHFVINKSWGAELTEDSITKVVEIKFADHAHLALYNLKGKQVWSYTDKYPLDIKFNGDWQHAITTNMIGENIYWNIARNKKLFNRNAGMSGFGSMFTKDRRYYLSMAPLNLEEGINDLLTAVIGGLLLGTVEIPQIPQLWDVRNNRAYQFKANNIKVKSAEFSPDEKFIIAYDFERNVTIWNIETRKQLELTGHYKKIKQVDFSDDGKFILTFSEDGTVRIWDYEGNEIYTFDNLSIDPDEVGFMANSDFIYIKKYALRKLKWRIGDEVVKDYDTDGNEKMYANCEVIIKAINPAIIIKQIDSDKQLGTVWQMNSALKTKYKIK